MAEPGQGGGNNVAGAGAGTAGAVGVAPAATPTTAIQGAKGPTTVNSAPDMPPEPPAAAAQGAYTELDAMYYGSAQMASPDVISTKTQLERQDMKAQVQKDVTQTKELDKEIIKAQEEQKQINKDLEQVKFDNAMGDSPLNKTGLETTGGSETYASDSMESDGEDGVKASRGTYGSDKLSELRGTQKQKVLEDQKLATDAKIEALKKQRAEKEAAATMGYISMAVSMVGIAAAI